MLHTNLTASQYHSFYRQKNPYNYSVLEAAAITQNNEKEIQNHITVVQTCTSVMGYISLEVARFPISIGSRHVLKLLLTFMTIGQMVTLHCP